MDLFRKEKTMKTTLAKWLSIVLASILILSVTACTSSNSEAQKADTQNSNTIDNVEANTDTETISDEISQETVESSDAISEDETEAETDGPIVLENFSGGILVDEADNAALKFEITSIEMIDAGLAIYYNTNRDNGGNSNYFSLTHVKIDGCQVHGEYYAGDILQTSGMGRTSPEAKTAPLYYLISNDILNSFGFDGELTSLEFRFSAGYSAYSSVNIEYEKDFMIFPGTKTDIAPHELVKAANHYTIAESDTYQYVLTDVNWYINNLQEKAGQYLTIYAKGIDHRSKMFIGINIGDTYIGGTEDLVWAEADNPEVVTVLWTRNSANKDLDLSSAPLEQATLSITITDFETNESTELQVPVNLGISE